MNFQGNSLQGEERKGTRPSSGERVSVGADLSSPSPTPSLLGDLNIPLDGKLPWFCQTENLDMQKLFSRGAHTNVDFCWGTPLPRLHSLVIARAKIKPFPLELWVWYRAKYASFQVQLLSQDGHLHLPSAKGLWKCRCKAAVKSQGLVYCYSPNHFSQTPDRKSVTFSHFIQLNSSNQLLTITTNICPQNQMVKIEATEREESRRASRSNCETQPPASIGWVALSSVVRSSLFVPHR